MKFDDYGQRDRELIARFIELIDGGGGWFSVDDLQDDEVFFDSIEHMSEVSARFLDSPGSYGSLARDLREFFGDSVHLEDDCYREMDWGYVSIVDDGRVIVCSNSWSDSGLFLNDDDYVYLSRG